MKNTRPVELVALDLVSCAPTYSKGWGAGAGGIINPVANATDDLRELAYGKSLLGPDIMIRILRGFAKTIPFMFAEGNNIPGPYKLLWDVEELARHLTVAEMRKLQQPIRDGASKLKVVGVNPDPQPVTLTVHTGHNNRTTIDYAVKHWVCGKARARRKPDTLYYMQCLEAVLEQVHNIDTFTYRDLLHILRPDVDGEQFREIQRPFIEAALISQTLEYDARGN